MQIVMFTKMLKNTGNLPLDKAGDYIARLGFDGADLTVREGGYVLPENVSRSLPKAVETLNSKGLDVPMITTSVTDAEKGNAEEIFKTASKCGVRYIKLGYWIYEGFGKLKKQLEETRRKVDGLYKLSMEYGVTSTIHTHAGRYLTGNPVLLYLLLEGHDPEWLGAYIDPGHLFAEAGPYGWEMAIDILAPFIKLVAVKNYRWIKVTDEKRGKTVWKTRMLPLKEEIVSWPEVFMCLKRISFDGCVSVHSEYKDLGFEDLIRQTKEDLDYLRKVTKKIYG